jgi:hypothetical protein
MKRLFALPTIGKVDVGESVGFQATVKLKAGDEINLKTQVPKNSAPYGKARVEEVQPRKPYTFVRVVRIS